jgi:C1A family cysteine protease
MSKQNEKLESIKSAIESEGASWLAGPSEVFEMSQEDQDLLLGYVPGDNEPSLEEKEEASQANYQEYMAMLSSNKEAFSAPSSYDLRNVGGKNFITPVKNQRSCGSCVSFGTIATVEGTIRKSKNDPNYAVDFSEAHLFYCHARSEGRRCSGSKGGWWVPPAMRAFKDKGVTDEAHYPYTPGDQNCTGLRSGWQNSVKKITNFRKITSISQMKDWLSTKGPLTACYTVYSDFSSYRSGVYRKTAGASRRGGHCVSIVGYSDSGRYWICKNSWGTGWGEQGFFRIGYGQCGIDNEVWGVEGIVDSGSLTKKVTALWANSSTRNAYVYLSGEGWKKISDKNDTNFYIMLTYLATAKGMNRNVTVKIDKGEICEVYA